jgi:hypothetical protein
MEENPSRRYIECSQSAGGAAAAADDSNFSIMHFMSQYGMNFISLIELNVSLTPNAATKCVRLTIVMEMK